MMLRGRAAGVALIGAVVLALVLIPVGRWGASRGRAAEERGIEGVFAQTGQLDLRRLRGFRFTPSFDCLLFRKGAAPLALEVCFDAAGRAVEAIDRSNGYRWWSLRYEPSRAKQLVAPRRLAAIFKGIGADKAAHYRGSSIPLGISDQGPHVLSGS